MAISSSTSSVEGEIFSLAAMFPNVQERHPMQELHACAASANPDTMYLHEVMRQPNREHFLQAKNQEVNGQVENKNFSIFPWSSVPEGAPVLPSVWAMKQKRRIDTREVYKWKARLNVDGSKQVAGRDYGQTYAPVASWSSI